ncbi:MAG: hypothetical protein ACK5LV_08575 [Lachnospirales bacterium]
MKFDTVNLESVKTNVTTKGKELVNDREKLMKYGIVLGAFVVLVLIIVVLVKLIKMLSHDDCDCYDDEFDFDEFDDYDFDEDDFVDELIEDDFVD